MPCFPAFVILVDANADIFHIIFPASMARLWVPTWSLGALILLLLNVSIRSAPAQSPFETCLDATGGNATVIIPDTAEISIDGHTLAPGDEIAAVDVNGRCVGHLMWSGTGSEALTVWEAGLFQESETGLHPGDPITLHVWKHDDARLYAPQNSTIRITLDTSAPYLHDTLRYQRNGMYVVAAFTIRSGS